MWDIFAEKSRVLSGRFGFTYVLHLQFQSADGASIILILAALVHHFSFHPTNLIL
jgi:hypothetical protein